MSFYSDIVKESIFCRLKNHRSLCEFTLVYLYRNNALYLFFAHLSLYHVISNNCVKDVGMLPKFKTFCRNNNYFCR